MFDGQNVYTFKSLNGQPDLETLVRLFLDTISNRAGKKLNSAKYFGTLFTSNDECVLGSNQRNFEVRLYFLNRRETSGELFIIFILNNLNWIGGLKSLYLIPSLKIILWFTLRILRKSFP